MIMTMFFITSTHTYFNYHYYTDFTSIISVGTGMYIECQYPRRPVYLPVHLTIRVFRYLTTYLNLIPNRLLINAYLRCNHINNIMYLKRYH